MKVYISGPITGVSDFEKNFQSAEDYLSSCGYEVINPVKIGKKLEKKNAAPSYEDYMKVDIAALIECDAIFMLKGSSLSSGAKCEKHVAESLGLKIMYDRRPEFKKWIDRNYPARMDDNHAFFSIADMKAAYDAGRNQNIGFIVGAVIIAISIIMLFI